MHILFLCSWYPSRIFKTNGDFIQRHAEAVALKHSVSVLHLVSDATIAQIEIDRQQSKGLTTYIVYIPKTNNPLLKGYRFYTAYKQVLKKIDAFDLVHLNGMLTAGIFALHLKWTKKTPFIISEHFTGYLKDQAEKIGTVKKLFLKYLAKNASFICPVSQLLANNMQQIGLNGKYQVVGNVIDTELFKPIHHKNDDFTILHVSNMLNSQKNIVGMLRVAKELAKKTGAFTWKFIGGSADNYLRELAGLQQTGANVQFYPHCTQASLAKEIQTTDLCISFSNYETFGIVIAEAVAAGMAVIATPTGIACEPYLKDFIYTVAIGDETALLNSIIAVKKRSYELETEKMHQCIASRFKPQIIAQQFTNLYQQTLLGNT